MTIEDLYYSYRQKLKNDPDFELERCRYEFGGKVIWKVTKRNGYHVYTYGGVTKVTGTEKVK